MKAQPQTSVIIPVLDGERFVLEAVLSVLDQLDEDDELLLVDDASVDGTRALLELPDHRVKVLEGPGRGPSAARNVGLSAACGELIAFLDHDDLWPPERHAVLREALLADSAIEAAAGRIFISVEPGCAEGSHRNMHQHYGPSLPWSCLFRRTVIDRAGYFDESLRYGEDVDYYLRLIEAGMKVVYCDHYSLIYRRHSGNASNSQPPHAEIAMALVARKVARLRRARSL